MKYIEMEETFLHSAITAVLPDLSEVIVKILEEKLEELGVETSDDFQFVSQDDLLSSLRPIQARKLLEAWKQKYQTPETSCSGSGGSPGCPRPSSGASISSDQTPETGSLAAASPEWPGPSSLASVSSRAAASSGASSGLSASCQSFSPRSSSSNDSNIFRSPDRDWVESFMIPWDQFPDELIHSLERGEGPSSKLRKEMIRILVIAMKKKCSQLGSKHAEVVAKKMVEKYPKSLKDVIAGDVPGTGYDSIKKQLVCRINNQRRPEIPHMRKRKRGESDSGSTTDEVSPERRAAVQDTYGCLNWQQKLLPLGETKQSQLQKKAKMKMMEEQQTDVDRDEVKGLMRATFYTQRKEVNQGKSIKDLLAEWPLCFQELGMVVHFQNLTGIELKEVFGRNLEVKGERLLKYLNRNPLKISQRYMDAHTKYKLMRGEQGGMSDDVKEMVLLLLAYFKEKEDEMFRYVEQTCLAREVQMDNVPLTPAIIVCGKSCYSAKRYMLSVDQVIVHDNIPTFVSAVCMMFGSYYCFNIHYPSALASTLEFLQRCMFSINPEKGIKVESKKARLSVNPRVSTLIQALSDHEWRDV